MVAIAGNPFWTPYSGVALDATLSDADKLNVARLLIAQLPRHVPFVFQCPSHTPETAIIRQAFSEAGFALHGNRTRVLRPDEPGIFVTASADAGDGDILAILDPSAKVETGESIGKTRAQIRKAARQLEMLELSVDEFVRIYEENLRRDHKTCKEPLSALRSVLAYGLGTGNVRIFAAGQTLADGAKSVDAAIACAWDNERYYVWRMTVRKPANDESAKPHPHAAKLVLVHAMRDARSKGLVFDTEGGGTGQTDVLYPRLRINGEEERLIAARYSWPILTVLFAKKVVKRGIRTLKDMKVPNAVQHTAWIHQASHRCGNLLRAFAAQSRSMPQALQPKWTLQAIPQ
jgi:hypothetical protein